MRHTGSDLHQIPEPGLLCIGNHVLSLSAMVHQIYGCWYRHVPRYDSVVAVATGCHLHKILESDLLCVVNDILSL
jgi:hypothetical protein